MVINYWYSIRKNFESIRSVCQRRVVCKKKRKKIVALAQIPQEKKRFWGRWSYHDPIGCSLSPLTPYASSRGFCWQFLHMSEKSADVRSRPLFHHLFRLPHRFSSQIVFSIRSSQQLVTFLFFQLNTSAKRMLDVLANKEELLADAVTSSSSSNASGSGSRSKPYLKFGVSAILGLDEANSSSTEQNHRRVDPPELELLPELTYYHHHLNNNKQQHFHHPAYIQQPYFHHPLIHHHVPTSTKSFHGKSWPILSKIGSYLKQSKFWKMDFRKTYLATICLRSIFFPKRL